MSLVPEKVTRRERFQATYERLQAGADVWGGNVHGVSLVSRGGQPMYVGYYPETEIATSWVETSGTAKRPVADGSYVSLTPDGRAATFGQAADGLPVGTWLHVNTRSGSPISECLVGLDYHSVALMTAALQACLPDTADWSEVILKSGAYQKGELKGIVRTVNLAGKLLSLEAYANGRQTRLTRYDTTGELFVEIAFDASGEPDTLQYLPPSMRLANGDAVDLPERMPAFPAKECPAPPLDASREALEAHRRCSEAAMLSYIYANIRYPNSARKAGLQGVTVTGFIVERDGSISDPHTVRFVSKSLDEESVRVVESMPKWQPGYQGGEPVRVSFNLPVQFRLE